jgi:FAD/FMN-containing dehydrogenase
VQLIRIEKLTKQPDQKVLSQFQALLGSKGYSDDRFQLSPWESDWRGVYHGTAAALLSPASVEEVQGIVNIARETGTAIVPQGGNTSMVGGATPIGEDASVILSLRRMNNIRKMNAESMVVEAEAGVILSNLHEAASAVDRRFPLTLGGKGSATVGGLISTNAGGTQVLRFGTMRRLVLGLEAVLPNGEVFSSISALKKDNRGFDLGQLMIGSEGTLGIVTAASLQLFPAIKDRAVGWMGVESPQVALKLLRALEAESGAAVESFEVIPQSCLHMVCKHIPNSRAPLDGEHPWHVLVEYVGHDAAAALEGLLLPHLQSGLVRDAIIGANETQAEAFWRLRDSISEAERAHGPAVQHDISVPVDAMPDFMVDAARIIEAGFAGVRVAAFGHLGDGNVHFHVTAPAGVNADAWREKVGNFASTRVYDLVVAQGGSISAEHGIGQMKRKTLAKTADPARLFLLHAVKQAIDPHGIFNPEKLVPLASDASSP